MTSNQKDRPAIKRFLIGRSPEKCDIVIDDPSRTVSSVHAELFQDGMNRWYLQDRQSRNGTFINRGDKWEHFPEGFVEPGQSLAFSQEVRAVSWLIEQAQRLILSSSPPAAAEAVEQVAQTPTRRVSQRGTFHRERDPETGRIVKKFIPDDSDPS